VPINSVRELIAYARANRASCVSGSPGSGSSQHLSGELFKKMSGVELQHVPYKSVAQMTTELVSGQFELSFNNAPLVLPHVRSGRLRALAVTTRTRLALAPDVPTLDESDSPGSRSAADPECSRRRAPRRNPEEARERPAQRPQLGGGARAVRGERPHRRRTSSAEFAAYMKSDRALGAADPRDRRDRRLSE